MTSMYFSMILSFIHPRNIYYTPTMLQTMCETLGYKNERQSPHLGLYNPKDMMIQKSEIRNFKTVISVICRQKHVTQECCL